MFNVAMTFRDETVHRISVGDDLEVAQELLVKINKDLLNENPFEFRNDDGDLIFVANLNNFLYAFIEEKQ